MAAEKINPWERVVLEIQFYIIAYLDSVCQIRIRSDPKSFAEFGSAIRISDPELNFEFKFIHFENGIN